MTREVNPIPKLGKKKKKPSTMKAARAEVEYRSHGWCEARVPIVCTGVGHHAHHLAGRGLGRDTAENLLMVCQPCHTYIHAHPAESMVNGWMRPRTVPTYTAPPSLHTQENTHD